MSLQKKASLYSGLVLLLLVGLLTYIGSRALAESTQRVLRERVMTAEMLAQGVDQALQEALADLEGFASIPEVNLDDADLTPERQALENLYRFSGPFMLVFLTDAQGRVIATQPQSISAPIPSGSPALAIVLHQGGAHISSLAPPGDGQRPLLSLAAPLRAGDGRVVGVVGGYIDPSQDAATHLIQPVRLGQTAYVEIVNEQGQVMATTKNQERAREMVETEYAAHFASLIQTRVATNETCYRCHQTQGGVKRERDVLAFAPLNQVRGGIAIRQTEAEALAPTRELRRDLFLLSLPMFFLGLGLTWLGTRSLVHPIRRLTLAARRIAQGDLTTAVASTSRDEIGALAQSFEQMRLKLNQSLREREERAREMEERARQLSALNSLASTVSRSLELEQILGDSLEWALRAAKLEAGAIFVRDASGQMTAKAHRGVLPELLEAMASFYPVLAYEVTLHPLPAATGMPANLFHVPLLSKGKNLGALVLVGPSPLAPQARELLMAIGHQIGTAIENAQLFAEAQRRESEAAALYGIGMETSRLLDLERILKSIVDNAQRLLEVDAVILSLVDEATQEIFIKATSGSLSSAFRELRLGPGQGIAGKTVSSGRAVATEDYLTDTTIVHTPQGDALVRDAGLRAHLSVPVTIGEQTIGALCLASRHPPPFSRREENLLQQLANQAAVAIENARLYNQVQALAILQERERLSREMHDGLGQALGYLQLQARTAEGLVEKGESEAAREQIQEMRRVAQEAYEEVRQSILALRSPQAPQADLIHSLEGFFSHFRQQAGPPLEVQVADVRATRFPLAIALQLVRVIQEALANVRKHAQSQHARVSFDLVGETVLITVEDDGVGFDPTGVWRETQAHFGLQMMEERCRSIGAELMMESRIGQGTKVIISLPLSRTVE